MDNYIDEIIDVLVDIFTPILASLNDKLPNFFYED